MLFVSKEVVSECIFILNMAADRVMFSLELGWSSINALECGLTSIFCLWLEEIHSGPGRVVSFPLDAAAGDTWRRDDVPHTCSNDVQICKDHSCTLAPLIHCTAHM